MGEFDAIDSSERALIELLLRLEMITREHLTEALEYQCRLPRSAYMSLEQILVDMEYLSQESLDHARKLLGYDNPALQNTRRSQLPDPVKEQPMDLKSLFQPSAPVSPPGNPQTKPDPGVSLPQGVQAGGAFAQRSVQPQAGNWAAPPQRVTSQVPKTAPVSATLSVQPLPDPSLPRPHLGEILIQNHELEEWQLTHALCIQRAAPQSTPKLGTLLVKLGYAEAKAVERALSSQKQ